MLKLVYAPNDVFKKKAQMVETVDENIRDIIDGMFEILQTHSGIGIGANMVGILKRIIVIEMNQDDKLHRYAMVNPEIIKSSKELQNFDEASLSFPGISAPVKRHRDITVKYLDYDGTEQTLDASGFLSTVIQHEMDYIDGRTFLDHLSKMKRDLLLKKMHKHLKAHPPHNSCSCC